MYHHNVFVCRAVSPELAATSISMKDLQAARNQRRRELRQQLTARRSLVELLTHPEPSAPKAGPVDKPRASNTTPSRRIKIYRED